MRPRSNGGGGDGLCRRCFGGDASDGVISRTKRLDSSASEYLRPTPWTIHVRVVRWSPRHVRVAAAARLVSAEEYPRGNRGAAAIRQKNRPRLRAAAAPRRVPSQVARVDDAVLARSVASSMPAGDLSTAAARRARLSKAADDAKRLEGRLALLERPELDAPPSPDAVPGSLAAYQAALKSRRETKPGLG